MASTGLAQAFIYNEILCPDLVAYKWDPTYHEYKVGVEEFFTPTAGQPVFQITKPVHNDHRKVIHSEFQDILSLSDVRRLMRGEECNLNSMYGHFVRHPNDPTRVSPLYFATHVTPFGVTSLSKLKNFNRDQVCLKQPVLIFGACHIDRANYSKQDTLRIPADLFLDDGCDDRDERRYVFLTFQPSKSSGGCDLLFVVSPRNNYVSRDMLESLGYSLACPIGVVDRLNRDTSDTPMYKQSMRRQGVLYFVEGFVFNSMGSWRVSYTKSPDDFYADFYDENDKSDDDISRTMYLMLLKDPLGRILNDYVELRRSDDSTVATTVDRDAYGLSSSEGEDDDGDGADNEEDETGGGDDRDSVTYRASVRPRQRSRRWRRRGRGRARFYGSGTTGGRERRKTPVVEHGGSVGGGDEHDDGDNDGRSRSPRTRPAQTKQDIIDGVQYDRIDEARNVVIHPQIIPGESEEAKKRRQLIFSLSGKPNRHLNNSLKRKAGITDHFLSMINSFLNQHRNTRVTIVPMVDGYDGGVTLTNEEILFIIAAEFMDRLVVENSSHKVRDEVRKSFSFNAIFKHSLAKLRCLVTYLNTSLSNAKVYYGVHRNVSFVTKNVEINDDDTPTNVPLQRVLFFGRDFRIEDFPEAKHTDFANRRFGGGVLRRGAVQEEIMIMCRPECLIGILVFDVMASNKTALEIIGTIPFSTYTGYSRTFAWESAVVYTQPLTLDQNDHALSEIVAFNAADYSRHSTQYPSEQFDRRSIYSTLFKAISAFQPLEGTNGNVPVITGPWGAGAFKNDALLTTIIQMCAAGIVRRPLIFTSVSFKVKSLAERLYNTLARTFDAQGVLDILIECGNVVLTDNNRVFSDVVADKIDVIRQQQQQQQRDVADTTTLLQPPTQSSASAPSDESQTFVSAPSDQFRLPSGTTDSRFSEMAFADVFDEYGGLTAGGMEPLTDLEPLTLTDQEFEDGHSAGSKRGGSKSRGGTSASGKRKKHGATGGTNQ